MHEVIGHASGQQAAGFKGTPQQAIKEHFSALEEGRADLVGLYFIADPKLVEIGVIPAADHDNIVRARVRGLHAQRAGAAPPRSAKGRTIAEDHMRNRQMIVRWLMANTKAIEQRTRDGKTYLVDGRSESVPRRRRASCSPKCSASSQRAITPPPRSCSTPMASTSIRSCATKSSPASTS